MWTVSLIVVAAVLLRTQTAQAFVLTGGTPPQTGPAPGERFTAIFSALFTYTKTDLSLAGPMPINVSRVYRSQDVDVNGNFLQRDFGLGTRLNYDIFLYSNSETTNNTFTDAEVVMPDGGEITCTRTSSCNPSTCSDYTDAVFLCAAQPTGIWFGSTIVYNANTPGWDLTRKDGTVYSFGKGAPLQKITDRYGNAITITHASGQSGNITQVSSSNGRSVTFSYTDSSNPTEITAATDSAGRVVNYVYNGNHKLQTVTFSSLSSNAQTSFGWGTGTQSGDITNITFNVKVQSGGGIATNANFITYDTSNRLKSVSSQLPSSGYVYNYTLSGSTIVIAQVTLPDNSVRELSFSNAGYVLTDTRDWNTSLAEETQYTRAGATSQILSVLDALGRGTSYSYDAMGNVLTVTHTPGPGNTTSATTTYTYEPVFNRVASIKEPLTPAMTISYVDPPATPTATIVDPVGRQSVISYNSSGQVISEQDPAGNTTSYTYDSNDSDLKTMTDPLGNRTTYQTDSVGRLTDVTSPRNHSTLYSYDAIGDILSATDANGNKTSYQYDLLGDPTQVTDPNGNITTITTTATLDVTTVCDSANNCTTENRDATGRRTIFLDKRGIKTAYTYDLLGRVTQVVYNSNNVSGFDTRTITYTYDAGDRVSSITDSEGVGNAPQLRYSYDPVDNIVSEQIAEGLVTYQYDANGRRTKMTASQMPDVSYTYDNDDQLATVNNSNASAALTMDSDGRLSTLTVKNVTTTYGYDNDSRLTSLSYVGSGNTLGNLTYAYDADSLLRDVGGSFARSNLPPNITASYTNTNQVNVWNGTSATDDAASNLTKNPAKNQNYAWDSRNMLTQVNGGASAFNYDALGRREKMTSGASTSYLHDGDASVVATSGSTVNNFLTDDTGAVLAFSSTVSGITTSYVPIQDGMGSTVALVDQNGSMVNSYTYDPAGAVTKTGTVSFPYQYGGAEFDSQTGLYHVGSYYDPVLERLVSGATPTGAGGPSLAGGSGPVSAGSGGAGPVGASGGPGLTLSQAGINAGIGAGAGGSVGALLLAGAASSEAPPVPVAFYIAAGIDALVQGLLDLFGGGGSPDVRPKLTVPIHAIQTGLLGCEGKLVSSQLEASTGGPPSP